MHEIQLKKNSDKNIIHRADTTDYKVIISHLSWWVPIVTPSSDTLVKLETYLASEATTTLFWEAMTVYRSDIRKDKNASIRVGTTIHKPNHVYIVFSKKERWENQGKTNMIFDGMDLCQIQIEVGNKKFPEIAYDICKEDSARAYASLLAAGMKNMGCDCGSMISLDQFINLYPVYHFDLSSMEPSIFESNISVDIMVNYTLKSDPSEYYIFTIVVNERKAEVKAIDQKIYLIP